IRFLLALVVLVVLVHRLPTRRELRIGAVIGVALAGGYLTQTAGLAITSPGNAGLITGLFVVLTPVINRLFGAPIHWWTWSAVVISYAVFCLIKKSSFVMNVGDVLVLVCAVFFDLHIVLLCG